MESMARSCAAVQRHCGPGRTFSLSLSCTKVVWLFDGVRGGFEGGGERGRGNGEL